MQKIYKLISIITVSIISLIGCSGNGTTTSPTKPIITPQTLTVPLTYTLQGESMGLHMQIQVGNNPVYVGVDTGSVGLRVLASSLTNMLGITTTHTPEVYAYADGVQLNGVLATAPVTIAGVSVTIKFMLVQQVSCIASIPNCASAAFQANGHAGLMGVRLDIAGTSDGIWSPLGQLPGNLATGFIVTGYTVAPQMIIGLNAANTQQFNYISLESVTQPSSNSAPYPLWSVVLQSGINFPLVVSGNSLTTRSESGVLIYDTGTSALTIYNLPANESGSFAANESIQLYQTLNIGNSFTWGLTTGTTAFVNAAVKIAESSTLLVNTGNDPFTQLDILYSIESGLIGFRTHTGLVQRAQTTQMIFSDSYSCAILPVCNANESAGLSCVSAQAYQNCLSLQSLNQNGIQVNDSNNLYILMFQAQGSGTLQWPLYMNISNPSTLFAGFTMTYNPDISAPTNLMGWPVNDLALQQQAYTASSGNTCLPYTNNGTQSFGPWLSHCSAFAAWAVNTAFAAQVPPAQPQAGLGYDWCGLADKNNADLNAGEDGWASVSAYSAQLESPVAAQILANMGCAVVANYYNSGGAGHIAVVLPSAWSTAQSLQLGSNYPLNVLVNNSNDFTNLLAQVGPEEMQAGLYNFQHTVVYNGFFSELQGGDGFSSIVYFYNPVTCPN